MVAPLIAAAGSVVGSTVGGGSSGGGGISEYTQLIGGVLNGLTDFIATAIPTKYDKARKKRIQELTGMKSTGELGLTPSQLQEIETLGAGGIQATQKEFYQRSADTQRTSETQSPNQLAIAQAAQAESLRRQQSEMDRQILASDRQREAEQLSELGTLNAEQRARNKQIAESAKSFMTLGLMSGSKAVDVGERNKQLLGNTTTAPAVATPTGSPADMWESRANELRALGWTEDMVTARLGAKPASTTVGGE